jgi:hypothetical protein
VPWALTRRVTQKTTRWPSAKALVVSCALGVIHDEVFMIPQIKAYLCTDHSPIEKYEPEDRVEIDFWFDVDIGVTWLNRSDYLS